MSRKHPNYLRAERRRVALTQADIAILIGGRSKPTICRYERGMLPPIEVALAYEAILELPVADLLAGSYAQIGFNVRSRARALLKTSRLAKTARQSRRRRTLERLAV